METVAIIRINIDKENQCINILENYNKDKSGVYADLAKHLISEVLSEQELRKFKVKFKDKTFKNLIAWADYECKVLEKILNEIRFEYKELLNTAHIKSIDLKDKLISFNDNVNKEYILYIMCHCPSLLALQIQYKGHIYTSIKSLMKSFEEDQCFTLEDKERAIKNQLKRLIDEVAKDV